MRGNSNYRELVGFEVVDDLAVENRRLVHRVLAAGAADAAGADRLEMPAHARLGEELGGVVRALILRLVGVLLFVESLPDANLVLELLDDRTLVVRLHRLSRLTHLGLIDAEPVAFIPAHELVIEDDGVVVVTGVEVRRPEIVHHPERLVVPALVTRERLEEVVRLVRLAEDCIKREPCPSAPPSAAARAFG